MRYIGGHKVSERLVRLSKEGFWIIFGQAVAMLGGLVGVRILTELLNPYVYGELALGMTVATLVNQILFGPVGNGIVRFYAPAVAQNALESYFKATRRLVLWATVSILLLILFLATILQATGHTNSIAITSLSLIFGIIAGYNAILNGVQSAARQRSVVAVHKGMESWMRYLIASLFVWCFSPDSSIVLAGYNVAVVLTLVSQYIFFQKKIYKKGAADSQEKYWRDKILQYSWPFASWGIFTWVQIASDRWSLSFFSTTQDVGYYAVLLQLGFYPISIALGLVTQFLGPIFFQRIGDGKDCRSNSEVNRLCWRLTLLTFVFTVVVFFVALFCHKFVFQLLVAQKYSSVSYLLAWVMLASGLFATGETISLNLMSQMQTRTMVGAKIFTAMLGIILNISGAYFFGLAGVVSARIFFSVSYMLWMVFLSIRNKPFLCNAG